MKYYAVVAGRVPGIYTDWKTVSGLVQGYPGAIFKSFSSVTEANRFMNESMRNKMTDERSVMSLADKTLVYTDGSYSAGQAGYGVVIVDRKGDKYTANGNVKVETNNAAELYAIYVALSLIENDVIIYTDSRYAIGCLTAYIGTWIRTGWSGVANRELIEAIYAKMSGRNVYFEHVSAHKGIPLNEEADRLANLGRQGTAEMVITKNGEVVDTQ